MKAILSSVVLACRAACALAQAPQVVVTPERRSAGVFDSKPSASPSSASSWMRWVAHVGGKETGWTPEKIVSCLR